MVQRLGWLFIAVLSFTVLLPSPLLAVSNGEEVEQDFRTQLDPAQIDKVESFWEELDDHYGRYFPDHQLPNIFDILFSDEKSLSVKEVLSTFLHYFFHEVIYNGKLMGSLIILTVLSTMLQTLQTAFEQKQVSRIAYAIVFMIIVMLAMDSFSIAMETAKQTIGNMIDFMLALVPFMLTLLIGLGNITSVAFFHPLTIFMIHIVGTVIYKVVFPLLFFSAVLSVVSSITEKYPLNQLSDLLRKSGLMLQGGLLTIFLSVISIQGATTAVADGVTIRTAKYITGNFVPVIGRTISDATDTVVGASLVMKNTVGLAGVFILLLICAFPAIKILCLAFIYKASAAIMQPLGNNPIVVSISTIGRTLIYVFASMAAVALMFFLAITIIIASGTISVMVR